LPRLTRPMHGLEEKPWRYLPAGSLLVASRNSKQNGSLCTQYIPRRLARPTSHIPRGSFRAGLPRPCCSLQTKRIVWPGPVDRQTKAGQAAHPTRLGSDWTGRQVPTGGGKGCVESLHSARCRISTVGRGPIDLAVMRCETLHACCCRAGG